MTIHARKPVVAVTMGDISGIGPEIVARVLAEDPPADCHLVVVDDIAVLDLAAALLKKPPLSPSLKPWNAAHTTAAGASMCRSAACPSPVAGSGPPPGAGR